MSSLKLFHACTAVTSTYIALGWVQGAMYKQMEAGLRHAQLQQIARQLDILEQTIEGPFVLGEELCHADASIFPTLDFMVRSCLPEWSSFGTAEDTLVTALPLQEFMLPSIFGWRDVYLNRPKLKAYREAMLKDPAGAKVCLRRSAELLSCCQDAVHVRPGLCRSVKS